MKQDDHEFEASELGPQCGYCNGSGIASATRLPLMHSEQCMPTMCSYCGGTGRLVTDAMNEIRLIQDKHGTVVAVEALEALYSGKSKPSARKPPKPKEAPPEPPKTVSESDTRDHLEVVAEFVRAIAKSKQLAFIGIDPGKKGAIGLVHPTNSNLCTAIDIPMRKVSGKGKTKGGNVKQLNLYDDNRIWQMFKLLLPYAGRLLITLEEGQAHAVDTAVTAFSVGWGTGMWPLFLLSHDFALEPVKPPVWKRAMGLTGKDKEWSRLMAQRLWPNAPLCRKKDDGRAEAMLLAEWSRRQRYK